MKIVAIRDMSKGNETTGEAWQETAIFDESQPISDIIEWASNGDCKFGYKLKRRVQITTPEIRTAK